MAIGVVMFDFGGVLVRTLDQSYRTAWEKRLGLAPNELARLVFDNEVAARSTIGIASENEVWEHVAGVLKLSPADFASLRHDFWQGDFLDRDLVSFIAGLRPRFRTALLSNAWEGARALFTQKYHLDQWVDEIFISSELGLAKPAPAIFQTVIERLGVRPEEIVFVDDFASNIAGAEAAGIQAIHFKDSAGVMTRLKGLLAL